MLSPEGLHWVNFMYEAKSDENFFWIRQVNIALADSSNGRILCDSLTKNAALV